jgi:hypothetical protein
VTGRPAQDREAIVRARRERVFRREAIVHGKHRDAAFGAEIATHVVVRLEVPDDPAAAVEEHDEPVADALLRKVQARRHGVSAEVDRDVMRRVDLRALLQGRVEHAGAQRFEAHPFHRRHQFDRFEDSCDIGIEGHAIAP